MSGINLRSIQRGRLLERISQQRAALAVDLAPVVGILDTTDQIIQGADKTRRWIGENPLIAGTAVIVFVIWRPRGVLKLAKKGIVGWKTWRLMRRLLG